MKTTLKRLILVILLLVVNLVLFAVLMNVTLIHGMAAGPDPPIVTAAKLGDMSAVDTLLNSGVDINARCPDSGCDCALVAAGRKKNLQMVAHLVARGANVNTRDYFGATVYDIMNYLQIDNIATYIRKHGGRASSE